MIAIIYNKNGDIFSLNNRRLYVIKYIYSLGLLESRIPKNTIYVRIKNVTDKEMEKFTIERCSLQAVLMREKINNSNNNNNNNTNNNTDTTNFNNDNDNNISITNLTIKDNNNNDNNIENEEYLFIDNKEGPFYSDNHIAYR